MSVYRTHKHSNYSPVNSKNDPAL